MSANYSSERPKNTGDDLEKNYRKTYAAAKKIDTLPEVEKRELFEEAINTLIRYPETNPHINAQTIVRNKHIITTLEKMRDTGILPTDADRMDVLAGLLKTKPKPKPKNTLSQIEGAVNVLHGILLNKEITDVSSVVATPARKIPPESISEDRVKEITAVSPAATTPARNTPPESISQDCVNLPTVRQWPANYTNEAYAEAARKIIDFYKFDKERIAGKLQIELSSLNEFLNSSDAVDSGELFPSDSQWDREMIGNLSYLLVKDADPEALIRLAKTLDGKNSLVSAPTPIAPLNSSGNTEMEAMYAKAQGIEREEPSEQERLFDSAIASLSRHSRSDETRVRNKHIICALETMRSTGVLPINAEQTAMLTEALSLDPNTLKKELAQDSIRKAVELLHRKMQQCEPAPEPDQEFQAMRDTISKEPATQSILELAGIIREYPGADDALRQVAIQRRSNANKALTARAAMALVRNLPLSAQDVSVLVIGLLTENTRNQARTKSDYRIIFPKLNGILKALTYACSIIDPAKHTHIKDIDEIIAGLELQLRRLHIKEERKTKNILDALKYMKEHGVPPTDEEGFTAYVQSAQNEYSPRVKPYVAEYFKEAMKLIGLNLEFDLKSSARSRINGQYGDERGR